MKIKKFIKSVTNYLGLGDYKIEGKKRSLKDLIKKLNERKSDIKKKLKESSAKKEKKNWRKNLKLFLWR